MKGKPFILFQVVDSEGKKQEAKIYTEDLRKMLNEAKLSKSIDKLELELETQKEKFKIPITVSDLRKLIKQSELYVQIVPPRLSEYLVDLTHKFAIKPIAKITGRDNEIEKIWFYLSQSKRNNVFLVGPPDVGKTTIANEIARQISTNECPKEYYRKRVLLLRPELILKIKSEVIFEHVVESIMKFLVKNKDKIVLYIDKAIYMKTDYLMIEILNSIIAAYNIPVITTIKEEEFDKYFFDDPVISKYINYIYIDEPELEEIEPMIKKHIIRLKKQYGIKISPEMIKYAIFTSELSSSVSANPGNVINIFERAFLEAKRKDKQFVDKKSILSCYNTYLKEYEKMSIEEKTSTAYHETGHYILALEGKNRKNAKISCVSILPMNWWSGVTISYKDLSEYVIYSKEYFIDYIAFCLAGRVAEKKFTNLDSAGAANDLEKANDVARAMIMQWGFSETEHNHNRQYDLEYYYLMPESKKELIDKEIQAIIDEGTKRAEEVINKNEGLLKIIVEKLLEQEILTGEQLKAICDEYSNGKK